MEPEVRNIQPAPGLQPSEATTPEPGLVIVRVRVPHQEAEAIARQHEAPLLVIQAVAVRQAVAEDHPAADDKFIQNSLDTYVIDITVSGIGIFLT